ncbi:TPA: hypothetical protein JBE44_15270, partial [Legionella pneumophila subsp. pneumophila]|nr:hypothetical protein [Legionella pneumophila subsp. pneumophila]HAT9992124.1 hypothetical protein [Legionella pneumophila subsp. pneumophila]
MDVASFKKFITEYSDCSNDVINSNFNNYIHNLNKYLSLINNNIDISNFLKTKLPSVDFATLYESGLDKTGGMGACSKIDWPLNKYELLSTQKELFEYIAAEKIKPHEYCLNFIGSFNNLNHSVEQINEQIFKSFSRDLKRLFEENYDNITQEKYPNILDLKLNFLQRFWTHISQ